jgi:hypothetical protein
MAGQQQAHPEPLECVRTLAAGRFRGAQGPEPARLEVIRLLPNLPIFAVLLVDLLQREVTPSDLEALTVLLLDVSQPNCCLIDIRSKVVEEDLETDRVSHHNLLSG